MLAFVLFSRHLRNRLHIRAIAGVYSMITLIISHSSCKINGSLRIAVDRLPRVGSIAGTFALSKVMAWYFS